MYYTHDVKGNWGTAVKTSAGYNWRKTRPNSNCNSGSNFIQTDHPLKNMEDRGIFDSGCSWHMTGNKDHLDDFEEYKGGSVTFEAVSPIPTLRIHHIHLQSQILGDPKSSVQTRSRVKQTSEAHALEEPKKIFEALQDDSWVKAMQEELLQFRLQQVWILVDLPHGAK
ncbi:hypothetical protein Tco_0113754, partial [Tanacetum coccineum]